MTSNPNSPNFNYKDYSLEKLQEWIHDVLSSDASPHEIYSAIREVVREDYDYHKNSASRAYGLLELLSGNRPVGDKDLFEAVIAEKKYYEGYDDGMTPWGHSDLEYQIANKNKSLFCDKDDKSLECQKAWNDFWEENYYPEEYQQYTSGAERYPVAHVYTEEEMNAMCDKAASDDEKQRCREYNLRESEYYDKRAQLDISSGNDSKVNYESGWIYESPDGGKTVTKRKVGSMEKVVVKEDKVKKWVLPVEEVRDEDTGEDEYCIAFPDDLLEAANLKEGDTIEWVDRGDGSYEMRKVTQPLQMDEC